VAPVLEPEEDELPPEQPNNNLPAANVPAVASSSRRDNRARNSAPHASPVRTRPISFTPHFKYGTFEHFAKPPTQALCSHPLFSLVSLTRSRSESSGSEPACKLPLTYDPGFRSSSPFPEFGVHSRAVPALSERCELCLAAGLHTGQVAPLTTMINARANSASLVVAALLAFLLAAVAIPQSASAPEILVTEFRIPTHSSGKKGLEAVMIRPNDNSQHPLALLTHGTPREAQERSQMTPLRLIPQAREFARRGWTAVIVMRRGYGDSGGGYGEDARACGRIPDYSGATKEAVRDLRESTDYLHTRPEIDPSRMIAIGISTGGLTMVGLAADPPQGLLAAINFAGGRGSNAPDHVCNPEDLIRTFADFGKRNKVPMLWVYAENDHYFGPALAQAFYRAFTQNGGKARFIAAPPFGEDGHGLFSQRGIPIWTPYVDDFLKQENLVLRDTLLQIPLPAVEPPSYLSGKALEDFQRYLLAAPHKAFAASSSGGIGMNFGQRTPEEAQKHAMENCKKSTPDGSPCSVVMSDDQQTTTATKLTN
jgi:dienelactone hydrolase